MTWRERIQTLEEEEKYHRGKYLGGSKLEDIFDILRTGEYAAGGHILRMRQLKEYVDTERQAGRQPTATEVYKRVFGAPTEGAAHGIAHRISPSAALEIEGFWAGLAADIFLDPTTYLTFGVSGAVKFTARVAPKAAARLGEGIGGKVAARVAAKLKLSEDIGEKVVPKIDAKAARATAQKPATPISQVVKPDAKVQTSTAEEIAETGFVVKEIQQAVKPLSKIEPPTKAEAAAAELRKIYDDIHAEKVELGMIKPDHYNLQFMHHTLTQEGREYIMEKHGGDIGQFMHDQGVSHSRTIQESTLDINKKMLEQHGIKEFFVEDPFLATNIYISKHAAAAGRLKKSTPQIADQNAARTARISELSKTTSEAETKDAAMILEEGPSYWILKEEAIEAAAKAATPDPSITTIAERRAIAKWDAEDVAIRKAKEIAAKVDEEIGENVVAKRWQDAAKAAPKAADEGELHWFGQTILSTQQFAQAKIAAITASALGIAAAIWTVISDVTSTQEYKRTKPKGTKATVARVVDGDTIITEDGERIRLLGIDTPEKGEPGYDHAKQRLKELVLDKEVYLESDVDDTDKYGRSLRYIHHGGINVNLQLVKEGYARTLFYRNKKYKKELLEAKKEAEKNEIGPLWNETIRATLPLTYDTAQWRDPTATIEQKEAAWIAAGEPLNVRMKTIQTSPTMEILALTKEEYQASQGFKPTIDQLEHVIYGDESSAFLIGKEIPESREARYKELVDEWKAFEAGKARLEHPTTEQEMESWRRAGLAPGQKYTQKIYRDELGKLLGVGTYTPEELEEMGGFTPSETQAEWAFRSTRKMKPVTQFKAWAEEHKTQQEQERQMQEELAGIAIGAPIKLQKHDPFIPLGLTMTTRRARRRELEEMLGEGVDR